MRPRSQYSQKPDGPVEVYCYDARKNLIYWTTSIPGRGSCHVTERPGARTVIIRCPKEHDVGGEVDWKCHRAGASIFTLPIVEVHRGPDPWIVLQHDAGRKKPWIARRSRSGPNQPDNHAVFATRAEASAHAAAKAKDPAGRYGRLVHRSLFEGLGR